MSAGENRFADARFLSVPTVIFGVLQYAVYQVLISLRQTMALEPVTTEIARKHTLITLVFWTVLPIFIALVVASIFLWFRAFSERRVNTDGGAY